MRARTLGLPLVLMALAACTTTESVDVAAEAQAIRDLSAQWAEAANAQDFETIGGLFASDIETIFDGEHIQGRDAVLANARENWSETPDGVVSWTSTNVEVAASGDLAVERGSWTFDPDGEGEAEAEHGEYVTVWKKMDGAWMVISDSGTELDDEDDDDEMDDDEDDA